MIEILTFLLVWWLLWLSPFTLRSFWSRITYYAMLTSLLLYSGIATMGVYYEDRYPLRTVHKESTVHIGPDQQYVVTDVVHTEDTVRIVGSLGNWRKVENKTLRGWVVADCLEA